MEQSSGSHQAVIRQSSGSHQAVLRQSSGSHQAVTMLGLLSSLGFSTQTHEFHITERANGLGSKVPNARSTATLESTNSSITTYALLMFATISSVKSRFITLQKQQST